MSKGILKLKPECIKPGLKVMVDHYGDQRQMFKGEVIKKLRKNWLVKTEYGIDYYREVSVPYERLTTDIGFTKEGRPLLGTEEDKKIFWSKEHIDYHQSLCVAPRDKSKIQMEEITI